MLSHTKNKCENVIKRTEVRFWLRFHQRMVGKKPHLVPSLVVIAGEYGGVGKKINVQWVVRGKALYVWVMLSLIFSVFCYVCWGDGLYTGPVRMRGFELKWERE